MHISTAVKYYFLLHFNSLQNKKMVCLKKEFKSRTKIEKFNTKREEFYVYGLWLEIFKDYKGIYICVNKQELDKICQIISFLSRKYCFYCDLKDCFICKRFRFIYKQYMHYIDKQKNKMLWKIYLKTNKYGFELKHII